MDDQSLFNMVADLIGVFDSSVPSEEWNTRDRMMVIDSLAQALRSKACKGMILRGGEYGHIADILHFLASESPEFLEANRAMILEAAGISEKKEAP